jgi:hypothetical protein
LGKVSLDEIVAEYEATTGARPSSSQRATRWYYRTATSTQSAHIDFTIAVNRQAAKAAVRKRLMRKRLSGVLIWPAGSDEGR